MTHWVSLGVLPIIGAWRQRQRHECRMISPRDRDHPHVTWCHVTDWNGWKGWRHPTWCTFQRGLSFRPCSHAAAISTWPHFSTDQKSINPPETLSCWDCERTTAWQWKKTKVSDEDFLTRIFMYIFDGCLAEVVSEVASETASHHEEETEAQVLPEPEPETTPEPAPKRQKTSKVRLG